MILWLLVLATVVRGVIVMTSQSIGCQAVSAGQQQGERQSGAIEPRCGQPRRIKEDQEKAQGEKHVGTVTKDK